MSFTVIAPRGGCVVRLVQAVTADLGAATARLIARTSAMSWTALFAVPTEHCAARRPPPATTPSTSAVTTSSTVRMERMNRAACLAASGRLCVPRGSAATAHQTAATVSPTASTTRMKLAVDPTSAARNGVPTCVEMEGASRRTQSVTGSPTVPMAATSMDASTTA
uniref:Putative secreted protein n=1 Tax=Ixodes ricinus TaxID=34613 RepID=A0A6B0UYD5_IXORI